MAPHWGHFLWAEDDKHGGEWGAVQSPAELQSTFNEPDIDPRVGGIGLFIPDILVEPLGICAGWHQEDRRDAVSPLLRGLPDKLSTHRIWRIDEDPGSSSPRTKEGIPETFGFSPAPIIDSIVFGAQGILLGRGPVDVEVEFLVQCIEEWAWGGPIVGLVTEHYLLGIVVH